MRCSDSLCQSIQSKYAPGTKDTKNHLRSHPRWSKIYHKKQFIDIFLCTSIKVFLSFGEILLWFPQLHAGRAPVSKTLWGRWPHTHFPVSPWMYAFQFYSSNHLRLVVKKHLSCKFIYRLDNIDDTFSLLTFFVGRLLVQDL